MFRKSFRNMLRKKILDNSHGSLEESNINKKRLKTDDSHSNLLDLSIESRRPIGFSNLQKNVSAVNMDNMLLQLQLELNEKLNILNLVKPPVVYVYNPLEYAFKPNEIYIRKYCTNLKKLLFVGMNPGPFGMCQTGVPFGDPKWVRDWLQIEGEVLKPSKECPSRKILGFASLRTEQSGDRFWGLFANICNGPEIFFRHSFVCNYCPLAFMKSNGVNVTPAEMNKQDQGALESVCNDWYFGVINVLQPEIIVAVGGYMETKTKALLRNNNIENIKLLRMPHPSPRAVNNQNWAEKAHSFLTQHDLMQYFQN